MSKVAGVFLAVVAFVASLLNATTASAVSTWSTTDQLYSSGNANPPIVEVNDSGRATLLWNGNSGGPGPKVQAQVGSTGSWVYQQASANGNSQQYSMTMDAAGNATAVWQYEYGLTMAFQSRTVSASGVWGPVENIATRTTDPGSYTGLVADPSGNLTAFEMKSGQILSYTKLVGQSWSGPSVVSQAPGWNYSAVSDSAGNLTLAWVQTINADHQIFISSKPFGSSWTTPQQVTSAAGVISDMQLISDSSGNLTLGYAKASRLWARTKAVNGTWTSAVQLSSTTVGYFDFRLGQDGAVYGTWGSAGNIQVSKLPLGGTWSSPETIQGSTNASYPSISVDQSGNQTVVWMTTKIAYGSVKLATSSTWETPVALNADNGTSIGTPQIDVNSSGQVVAAWSRGSSVLTASITNPQVRVPSFSSPVQTEDGFTVNVTNYDPAWTWSSSATSGGVVQVGTPTGSTLPITVYGLDPGTSSTLTATITRSGYSDGTATVSSSSLNAALTPTFGPAVRNGSGFSAEITNYDPTWTWTASATSGSASIVSSGGTYSVQVSGLSAGETVTVTVDATRSGYMSGSSELESSSLLAALNPLFDPVVSTGDGYEVDVINYDQNYIWTTGVDNGAIAFAVTSGSVMNVIVNGLVAGQSATLTVDTARSGYSSGQSTVLGTALQAALNPTFGSVTRDANGFTFDVQNYDASWNWAVTSTQGTVALGQPSGGTIPVTVSNLADGQSATVTVTTSRTGYSSGSNSQAGTALGAALTPQLSVPVKTSTGYIVTVTNYDPSWSWSTTATAGTVSQGTASGSNWQITVAGLSAGQSADLTIDTSRSGYVDGTSTVTSNALSAARTPTFDTPVRTATGYTVNVTNYNPAWAWTPSVSSGSVTVGIVSGSTLPLTVTGVASSASSTLSVDATRAGYLTGSATVFGTALGAALVPTFDAPVATADGFTVNVTNYNASWAWAYVASSGTLTTGTANGSTLALTVTGLAPGATSSITVDTTRSGYAAGQQVLAGATRAALSPVATLVLSAAIGQNVSGSSVTVAATGLQSSAPYSVMVYSAPRSLGAGTATAGIVTATLTIPSGLEEGWHRMVFSSTAFSGAAIEEVLYFKVSSEGALLATSTTAPVSLATTGNTTLFSGGLIVMLSLGLGFALLRVRRRLTEQAQ